MKIEESAAMMEIRAIRAKIWDDIKAMSPEQIQDYYKKLSADFEMESGIKLPRLQKTTGK